MRSKSIGSIIISMFLATLVLFTTTSSIALGDIEYNAINLTPSGYHDCRAYGITDGQQVGYGVSSSGQALLWSGSAESFIDLTPSGFSSSIAYETDGTHQVGSVSPGGRAILWNGSAEDYVLLHPASGYSFSSAWDICGTQQVGHGYSTVDDGMHALLWTGTAESFVDLHPDGFSQSRAYATNGTQQVGWAYSGGYYALLWNGSDSNYVILNPSGYSSCEAYDISGNQQVGYGHSSTDNNYHALIWSGLAESYVDLNPEGFFSCYAYGTNGTQQVGYGIGPVTGGYDYHALLWNSSADDYIDLHQLLPDGDYVESHAYAIDTYGNVVGYAIESDGGYAAFLWQPVPEPSTVLLLGLGGLLIRRRK